MIISKLGSNHHFLPWKFSYKLYFFAKKIPPTTFVNNLKHLTFFFPKEEKWTGEIWDIIYLVHHFFQNVIFINL